jgi:hypothetical protein
MPAKISPYNIAKPFFDNFINMRYTKSLPRFGLRGVKSVESQLLAA